MTRRIVRWSLLAILLVLVAGPAARAQTPEFGTVGPGEGGSGKSIGGDILAATGALEEPKGPLSDWYSAHAQATIVLQGLAPFRAEYSGPHSLPSAYELRTTSTATLQFAAKMPWEGGLLVINPEVSGGRGIGDVFGLGGATNGEAVRVGNPEPTPYFARFLYQQTFDLGGEWDKLADVANQIPGPHYKNNIVVKIGKMTATDDFDDNTFSHDPRTQFLNWGLMYNPTWDYPANVRGYTYGGTIEFNLLDFSARYGLFAVAAIANGAPLDPHILKAHGQVWEVEWRWTILNDRPGAIRLLGWLNNADMGDYRDALAEMPVNPNITATQAYRPRYGFGASWDQELIKGELGIFGRIGWVEGNAETWMFTEVDQTISIGMLLKGKRWDRPRDEVGLALLVNGLNPGHREYLAAGGLGFELGDGALSYAPETIGELYYNLRLRKGIYVTLDVQEILNPGYNHARGPVGVMALRTHFEY
jgi:high affinity Mn2+ porin